MKDNSNIDDIFRSGLEDFEMTPSEKSWNSLETDLSKIRANKRRKNFFRLFSVSLLLLLISFTAYKFYTGKNTSPAGKENKIESPLNKGNDLSSNAVIAKENASNVKPVISQNPVLSENKPAAPINPINVSKNEASLTLNPAAIKVAKSERTNEPTDVKTNTKTVSVNHSNDVIQKKNITRDEGPGLYGASNTSKVIAEQSPSAVNQTIVSSSSEKNMDNEKKPIEENISQDINSPFTVQPKPQVTREAGSPEIVKQGETIVQEPVIEKNVPEEKRKEIIPAVSSVNESSKTEQVNVSSKKESSVVVANENKVAPEPVASPVENTAGPSVSLSKKILSHISAEVYYSPDYVSNRLEINPDYKGTASRNINDYNDGKSDFSYSAGGNLRYHLGNHWSIASGISYSTFLQTAVYNTIQVVADSIYHEEHGEDHHHGHGGHPHLPPNINDDHHYVVQTPCGAIDLHNVPPHGMINPQNGLPLAIRTETKETIHFIYVPLLVRYQFGKNKFTYFIEGGGALNIVHYDQVKVTVNDAYTEDNNIDGLKKTNYSLLFDAGVQYNFYKGLSMFLRPSIKHSINPINQNNPVNTYPDSFGIGTGFSIRF